MFVMIISIRIVKNGEMSMKSILFDVDGVFLSEERCFDVSALTVEELLKSDDF